MQDRPNPPSGPLSTKNFRLGGYADYRPKFMYIAMTDLATCKEWAPHEYAAVARDDRPVGWKGPAISLRHKIADRLDREAKGPDPALYPALAIFRNNYPIQQDHQIRSTWENTSWQANETKERNHYQLKQILFPNRLETGGNAGTLGDCTIYDYTCDGRHRALNGNKEIYSCRPCN